MLRFNFIILLLGLGCLRCSAEDPAFLDTENHRGDKFPYKIGRPASSNFEQASDDASQKKISENETVGKSPGEKGNSREVEMEILGDGGGGGGGKLENRTEERHETPETSGFGYRKRIDRDENYDYFYEYETGDYYWKRKFLRLVLPEKKNVSHHRENSSRTTTTVPTEETFEPKVLAAEIPDSEKSRRYFDLVQFDEKYFSCPDNINETYPITGYCNRFVSCVSGTAYPGVCRGGLHFDLSKKTCDLPSNSFCNYACPKENGFFGVPGECNGFFSCRNWYPRYRTCPPHKHWDPEKEICSDEENSSCPLKCEVPYEVKPYEGDCRSYVICEKSLAVYRRCPPDTRFDLEKLGCVARNSTPCSLHPKLMIFRDYSEKNICASIGFKGEYFTWCKETLPSTSTSTSAPDPRSTSDS